MKIKKKILILFAFVFCVGCFFTTNRVHAQRVGCNSVVGQHCATNCDASTEEAISGTFTDCSSSTPICCKPKTSGTCNGVGGVCAASCTGLQSQAPGGNYDCGIVCCVTTANNIINGGGGTASGQLEFPNPLKFDNIAQVVDALLTNLRGILGTIAVIMIIIGGAMYMMSAGDEKRMETAKKIITGAVIGLAIVLAAPTFLKEIMTILGGEPTTPGEVAAAPSLLEIARNVLRFLLSIVGILGIISLIIGGVFYLTAYGDEDRIDMAKRIITASIIGIVIVFAALVIVNQVASLIK